MDASFQLQADFIKGSEGQIFALHHAPESIDHTAECFVVLPAFAEEMNRCRYMLNLLGQSLGSKGYGMLTVDAHGTGDSQGEFAESTWEHWLADIKIAVIHARRLGYGKVSFVAVRLGALLAFKLTQSIPSIERLIFWQPVVKGETHLNQFMRLKIAASIGRNEQTGSTALFEEQLEKGDSVQVAGYDISPKLFKGISSAHMEYHSSLTAVPIAWLTILASEGRKTPRPELQKIEELQQQGISIKHKTVTGPAFWQAHERTLVPQLIPITMDYITNGRFSDE